MKSRLLIAGSKTCRAWHRSLLSSAGSVVDLVVRPRPSNRLVHMLFLHTPSTPTHGRVMGAVRKQHMNIALWFGFFTASFVVFYLFSDGDFSFLMVS